MNNTPTHHLPAGALLNGKYRIEYSLGEGGFGITYKGTDTLLDMPVAIKEYFPNGFANRFSPASLDVTLTNSENLSFFSHWKERFLSEARTLAKFNEIKSIVNVRDFFEENRTAYIVMEFLNGITLKKFVAENGVIPPQKMVSMIIPLINALSFIHKQGLIHRDISPDNIMVMRDGTLKLFDFGAARDFDMQDQRSLSVMLKRGYSPQEQYRSKGKQGPWTDVYALCATIYFCITGVVPDDSMQRVFDDEIKLPSEIGIPISPYLESVIMKGMSIKEENRFQTMEELLHAIALKGENASAKNVMIPDKVNSGSVDGKILRNNAVPAAVVMPNSSAAANGKNADSLNPRSAPKSSFEERNSLPQRVKSRKKPPLPVVVLILLGTVCAVTAVIIALCSRETHSDSLPPDSGTMSYSSAESNDHLHPLRYAGNYKLTQNNTDHSLMETDLSLSTDGSSCWQEHDENGQSATVIYGTWRYSSGYIYLDLDGYSTISFTISSAQEGITLLSQSEPVLNFTKQPNEDDPSE